MHGISEIVAKNQAVEAQAICAKNGVEVQVQHDKGAADPSPVAVKADEVEVA